MQTQARFEIPIKDIVPGRLQPRFIFDDVALEELAESINSSGIIHPIAVRDCKGYFEILAGERRFRAVQLLGWKTITADVWSGISDQEAWKICVSENVQREQLHPLEEAEAYRRSVDEFGLTHEEVAKATGKGRVHVTNYIRLLKLNPAVKDLMFQEYETFRAGHGRALLPLEPAQQLTLARLSIRGKWSVDLLERKVSETLALSGVRRRRGGQVESSLSRHLKRVESVVSETVGSPAQLTFDKATGKGELKIRFSSLEIFDGILTRLGVDLEQISEEEGEER